MSDKPCSNETNDNDFQSIMDSLEKLVRRAEAGDTPLEESIKSHEYGISLIRKAQSLIADAEQRINLLTDKEEASVAPEELEDSE